MALRVAPPGRVSKVSLWLFAGGIGLWSLIVAFKLHQLQVGRCEEMRGAARRQQERVIPADPRRGMILDRMGRELAVSTDVYSVYAAPEEIGEKGQAAAALAKALGLPVTRIQKRLSSGGFVCLRRRVTPDVADRVRELEIPGIHFVTESKRFYPRGSLAAHVLGFVIPDEPKLREGLELRYDAAISGTPGALVALRDAHGKHFLMKARRKPQAGHDLVTSLDEVIQHVTERELSTAIRATGAVAGTAVVLHTPTGQVLAIANYPTFSPNRYGRAPAAARRNRAVMDLYEPGSTSKMFTAAAALEEGLVRPSEVIDCENGFIRVARVTIRDHKAFGLLSFADAIAQSSNVCTIKVGMRLDPRTFHAYLTRFGLGVRTGIDLPGETRGLLRHPSKWTDSSQAFLSFGQEIGATSIQIATAFSTIANRGVAVPPRVVTRIVQSQGGRSRVPERPAPTRAISGRTADLLIDLMEGVVTRGSGTLAAVPGYRVAGKTGTAQKIVGGTYAPDRHVSSFCGFVPSRRPVLTIHIVLDEPRVEEYHGGDTAAPVFSRVAARALEYLGVPPDAEMQSTDLARLEAGRRRADRSAPNAVAPASVTGSGVGGWIEARGAAAALRSGAPPVGPATGPGRRGAFSTVAPRPLDLSESGTVPSTRGSASASEAAQVRVPDLSGAPLRDAVVALARSGLAASIRGDGFVVRQDPPPGSTVAPGAEVTLTLGRLVEVARGGRKGEAGARDGRQGSAHGSRRGGRSAHDGR